MGQGGAMLGQLGQAGKGERESVVPLGIGGRVNTGGARYFVSCTFSLPCIGLSFTPKPLQGSHALPDANPKQMPSQLK